MDDDVADDDEAHDRVIVVNILQQHRASSFCSHKDSQLNSWIKANPLLILLLLSRGAMQFKSSSVFDVHHKSSPLGDMPLSQSHYYTIQ